MFPKKVQETVDRAADKLQETAADTKTAIIGVAVLGACALAVALVALAVALRKG